MTRTKALLCVILVLAISAGFADVRVFQLSGEQIVASNNASTAAHKANVAVVKVQEGRRTATAITCAVTSAISRAGEQIIVNGALAPETPFTRNLERLGYPPPAIRGKQAKLLAAGYVRSISARVERAVGHKGDRLIRPDGSIDCVQLGRLSAVNVRP